MPTSLEDFIREETLRTIENESIDLQVSAVDYVNKFFSDINPIDIKARLAECFTQEQIDEVVQTVPTWYEDIESRVVKKLINPSNKYSRDELYELYPTWMINYAISAFDSEEKRRARIVKEMKREARSAAQTVDKLKEVNKVVLASALTKLPVYN